MALVEFAATATTDEQPKAVVPHDVRAATCWAVRIASPDSARNTVELLVAQLDAFLFGELKEFVPAFVFEVHAIPFRPFPHPHIVRTGIDMPKGNAPMARLAWLQGLYVAWRWRNGVPSRIHPKPKGGHPTARSLGTFTSGECRGFRACPRVGPKR